MAILRCSRTVRFREKGNGTVMTLVRNNLYTEANWNTYGTLGRSESFGKRSGIDDALDFTTVRVGDYFIVSGTASDTGKSHTITFECTSSNASALYGKCVSHTKDGAKGQDVGDIYELLPVRQVVCERDTLGNFVVNGSSTFPLTCGYRKRSNGTITEVVSVTDSMVDGKFGIFVCKHLRSTGDWERYSVSGSSFCGNKIYQRFFGSAQNFTVGGSTYAVQKSTINLNEVDAVEFAIVNYSGIGWADEGHTVLARETMSVMNNGLTGRWYEFAGTLGTDVSFPLTNTDSHGWFIKSGNNFYMLIEKSGVAVNSFNSLNTGQWELMPGGSRKYFIGEAFFGAYAHFGSMIINGDWMLSQHGTIRGSASTQYTDFDPSDPLDTGEDGFFVPNFCVNMLTGETYMNSTHIKGSFEAIGGLLKIDGYETKSTSRDEWHSELTMDGLVLRCTVTKRKSGQQAHIYTDTAIEVTSGSDALSSTLITGGKVQTETYYVNSDDGKFGSFTTADGKTVTVKGGIITSIS